MALSALDDSSAEPTATQLADVLGRAAAAWRTLDAWLTGAAGIDRREWNNAGAKYGWSLRAMKGKRVIAYLIPQRGAFLVGLVLGDKALAALADRTLSAASREIIAGAKRYGEGTGFRIPVTAAKDLADIKTLVEIKLAH
ncbi:MAG TPA: DUF3788 domain-containing protein [Candidatus Krumholzibacteria bacterium]|nr:DUF3788 domain-containing protein [Candidatus Krumholzibacteria bacterium]HPD72944.1 DUF3788 domain-containing protein [Candidatus Krumholzibacteria bacterium]HRY41743.1 DUF3788 domain-containing protein [Candidatus Krumholzibacteria bacterium]